MTSKARHLRSSQQDRTISVDELFVAAFNKSETYYQQESLLGWRPVTDGLEPSLKSHQPRSSTPKSSTFTNSPDIKIHETSDAILIEVLLPHIDEDSLYLEISGDLLIIKALKAGSDHKDTRKTKEGDPDMVHRFVKLPINAKPGGVRARIDKGCLRIVIHKP